jgi:hypothetical protein
MARFVRALAGAGRTHRAMRPARRIRLWIMSCSAFLLPAECRAEQQPGSKVLHCAGLRVLAEGEAAPKFTGQGVPTG